MEKLVRSCKYLYLKNWGKCEICFNINKISNLQRTIVVVMRNYLRLLLLNTPVFIYLLLIIFRRKLHMQQKQLRGRRNTIRTWQHTIRSRYFDWFYFYRLIGISIFTYFRFCNSFFFFVCISLRRKTNPRKRRMKRKDLTSRNLK